METGLTKQQIITLLTRSPHGDLAQYIPAAAQAVREDPDFYSHLIAWNERKGSIRDSKLALPVIALADAGIRADAELLDNARAHLASLSPRDLVRAVRFAFGRVKTIADPFGERVFPSIQKRRLKDMVELYLRDREASDGRFMRVALQHRHSLKELYAYLHIKPGKLADRVLFKGEKVGIFLDVANLKNMDPATAASTIISKRIPWLVAEGALGTMIKTPDVLLALINSMTPAELVTNSKKLMALGVQTNPALRGAYDAKLKQASTAAAGKVATLKTGVAAAAVKADGNAKAAAKLAGEAERQMDTIAVDGDWLVLADKSGSMEGAIETARHVAGVMARAAKGKVYLTFFNNSPDFYDVTGKTLDEIAEITKRIKAVGGTCIGCGLRQLREKKLSIDGIALVSDCGETTPPAFATAYKEYSEFVGKEVPVYVYLLSGSEPVMLNNCKTAGVELSVFDLTGGVDYYSLPNLIQTMRTQRYSLVDEIMGTPLLKLADVLGYSTAKA